jgi:hypothetical protein
MKDVHTDNGVYWPAVIVVGVISGSVIGVNYVHFGFSDRAFVWSIRIVVKLAFTCFALSYVAAPLNQTWPSAVSRFLMKWRATTGASFAVAQLSAGVCVVFLWTTFFHIVAAVSGPIDRALGVVVLSWILTMLMTSNRYAMERIGMRWWRNVHAYGMMAIWIGYLLDYTTRTFQWSYVYGVFLLVLLCIFFLRARLLMMRLAYGNAATGLGAAS